MNLITEHYQENLGGAYLQYEDEGITYDCVWQNRCGNDTIDLIVSGDNGLHTYSTKQVKEINVDILKYLSQKEILNIVEENLPKEPIVNPPTEEEQKIVELQEVIFSKDIELENIKAEKILLEQTIVEKDAIINAIEPPMLDI